MATTVRSRIRRLHYCSSLRYPDVFKLGEIVQPKQSIVSGKGPVFVGTPTLPQWFGAVCPVIQPLHVYRTLRDTGGYKPKRDEGSNLTDARWLGPTTRLRYLRTIDIAVVRQVVEPLCTYFRISGLGYTREVRLAAMQLAWTHLPRLTSDDNGRIAVDAHWKVVAGDLSPADWLAIETQKAREFVNAALFGPSERHLG